MYKFIMLLFRCSSYVKTGILNCVFICSKQSCWDMSQQLCSVSFIEKGNMGFKMFILKSKCARAEISALNDLLYANASSGTKLHYCDC